MDPARPDREPRPARRDPRPPRGAARRRRSACAMSTLLEHWRACWFAPARPTNLAIWRIVFYGTTLLFYGGEDVAAWATVPEVFWHPIRLFGVVHLVVLPEATLHLLSVVWGVALAA